jgi:hypothetical protein
MVTAETAKKVRRLLTASRLKSNRRCQRLHDLKYNKGWKVIGSDDWKLKFGSLIHDALEIYFLSRMARDAGELDEDGQAIDPIFEALTLLEEKREAAKEEGGQQIDEFDLAKARAIMQGYHARWETDEIAEVLAVEAEFRAELVNPDTNRNSQIWDIAGKIDAIVRMKDGRVFIMEHKTSSDDITMGSTYWRLLRMDGQISMYYVGGDTLAAELGFERIEGCLYDILGKPQIRPKSKSTGPEEDFYKKQTKKQIEAGSPRELKKNVRLHDETPEEFYERCLAVIAENPHKFYQRGEVVRLENEVDDHMADTWTQGQIMRENERKGRAPRDPDACQNKFGRTCDFFDLCTGAAFLEDETTFYRVEDVHPELGLDDGSGS